MTIELSRRHMLTGAAGGVLLAACADEGLAAAENPLFQPAPEPKISSFELVDEELKPFFERPMFGPLTPDTLKEVRDANAAAPPRAGLPKREPLHVKIENSASEVYVITPENASEAPRPAMLCIHGGGYIVGQARDYHVACEELADALDVVMINVEYRLAPETSFPGPLQDCYDALKWTYDNAAELGVDRDRISVFGQSAGGGLTIALSLFARDKGEVPIKAQFPVYPMIDHRTGTMAAPVQNPVTGEFLWTREYNRFGWDSMRGDFDMNDKEIGYFSPSLAQDLSNLPPTFIQVGSLDLFLDEDLEFALQMVRAGSQAECILYAGAPHGFTGILQTAVARRFKRDLREAMARMI